MRSPAENGPSSGLARYAFGYSDKKPGKTFWLIQAALVGFVLYQGLLIKTESDNLTQNPVSAIQVDGKRN